MALSTQEQILIEQRVTNDSKSIGAAYLLWLFFGGFGAHRFYLGRTGSGFAMLALTIVGAVTLLVGVGAILLLVVGTWALVDAFLIPGMIRKQKDEMRYSMGALLGGARDFGPYDDTGSEIDFEKYRSASTEHTRSERQTVSSASKASAGFGRRSTVG